MQSQFRLERFSELLSRQNFSLAEACPLIAENAYPDLDIGHYLARIAALADLQHYLELRPNARDAGDINDKVAALRLACARLN